MSLGPQDRRIECQGRGPRTLDCTITDQASGRVYTCFVDLADCNGPVSYFVRERQTTTGRDMPTLDLGELLMMHREDFTALLSQNGMSVDTFTEVASEAIRDANFERFHEALRYPRSFRRNANPADE